MALPFTMCLAICYRTFICPCAVSTKTVLNTLVGLVPLSQTELLHLPPGIENNN